MHMFLCTSFIPFWGLFLRLWYRVISSLALGIGCPLLVNGLTSLLVKLWKKGKNRRRRGEGEGEQLLSSESEQRLTSLFTSKGS